MIKIGVVSLDVSHPKAFATELEKAGAGMKYEYVCNKSFRGDDATEFFVNRFGLAGSVSEIEDMVDKVDIGFIQSCNWDKHIEQAMPFIRAGKPVFLDKPMVGNPGDAEKIRELIKNGAKIVGSSSVRYCDEIREYLEKPVSERGEILSVYGCCGVDEFNYAIHIVEALCALAEAPAVSCRFAGRSTRDGDINVENYVIDFENGVTGAYQVCIGKFMPFVITVMTTKGCKYFEIDNGKIYISMLREIEKELTEGKSRLADIEAILNSCLIMVCGKKSRDERSGTTVSIGQLSDGDGYDGYAFESYYAATAGNPYK